MPKGGNRQNLTQPPTCARLMMISAISAAGLMLYPFTGILAHDTLSVSPSNAHRARPAPAGA